MRKAVKEGGVKLDAYGEKLFNIYTSNGFEPVAGQSGTVSMHRKIG